MYSVPTLPYLPCHRHLVPTSSYLPYHRHLVPTPVLLTIPQARGTYPVLPTIPQALGTRLVLSIKPHALGTYLVLPTIPQAVCTYPVVPWPLIPRAFSTYTSSYLQYHRYLTSIGWFCFLDNTVSLFFRILTVVMQFHNVFCFFSRTLIVISSL